MKIVEIDHVQLAIPAASEPLALAYYRDLLGMQVLPKPPELAKRGGVWFQCGTLQLHLGVEQDFHPAKKAHPAFRVEGLDELKAALRIAGYPVIEDCAVAGVQRFFTADPFGNRLEFMAC